MVRPHMAVAAARIRAIRQQGTFEVVPRQPITPSNPATPFQQLRARAIRNAHEARMIP